MLNIIIIELIFLLIKIISAAFNRSLDAVRIFGRKKVSLSSKRGAAKYHFQQLWFVAARDQTFDQLFQG